MPASAPVIAAPAVFVPADQQAPAPQTGLGTHVVQAGETLSSIAQSEGLGGWQSLWGANPDIPNPDLIYAGQVLSIPSGQ
jgi:nucleoid-associated protein YgaU